MGWISDAAVTKPQPCEIIHNVGLTQLFHGEFRYNFRAFATESCNCFNRTESTTFLVGIDSGG